MPGSDGGLALIALIALIAPITLITLITLIALIAVGPTPRFRACGADHVVDEVTLADQYQGEHGAHKGDDGSDDHQLVEGVRETDPVGVQQDAPSRRRYRRRGLAHAAGLHGGAELRAALVQHLLARRPSS